MQGTECNVCNVCLVQCTNNEKQKCKSRGQNVPPGSPVATYYGPPLAGGRAHVAIKGSEASATLIILTDL